MFSLNDIRREWFSNPRGDILAGIVVALALIPEAIGFSIIAGVDPKVGLYASFSIAVIIALVGGRPGMISAATAAVAVLVVPLVKDHGVGYLFAATILMGILQIVAGYIGFDKLMRFVSKSVMTGFVNALAILIFMAQLPQLIGVNWLTYPMIGAALAVIYILPRFTKIVPSPLVAIIVLTCAAIYWNLDVNRVGDMGGCAMIGQSVINVKSGGDGRLSAFVAGSVLLFLIVVLGPIVAQIPMPALVAVMIMVSIGTFSWRSVRELRTNPWHSSMVMVATVVAVVWTHDLAKGVLVGVLLSGIFFASKVSRLFGVDTSLSEDGRTRTYHFTGQIFFASVDSFLEAFDFREVIEKVVIDVRDAHFWDISAVAALDKAVIKLRREGTEVEVLGLNEASATLVDRFGVADKADAEARLAH